MHCSELIAHASLAAREAGDFIRLSLKEYGVALDGRDIKTTLDTGAGALIEKRLALTKLPIISEETFAPGELPEVYWLIDPLDGTANVVSGFGPYTVSIALIRNGRAELGFILDIKADRLWWTGEKGVYIDGERFVATPKPASSGILFTGVPLRGSYPWDHLDMGKFSKVRMIGCASMSILNVASGKGGTYFEDGIFFWDVAAALAIAERLGCSIELSIPDDNLRMKVFVTSSAAPSLPTDVDLTAIESV